MPIKIVLELDQNLGYKCVCTGCNSTHKEREASLVIRDVLETITNYNFCVERNLTLSFKSTQTDPSTVSGGTGTDATSN